TVSFAVAAAPAVSNVNPSSTGVNGQVTVTGTSFGSVAGSVLLQLFNASTWSPATMGTISWSDTQIMATVPSSLAVGHYEIYVGAKGLRTYGGEFYVVASTAPVISSSSRSAAGPGAAVTFYGSNFGSAQNGNTIALNGMNAPVQTWSDTAITALVPIDASSGN